MPISENHLQLDVPDVVGLKYEVVTKYYNTDIVFVPFDQPLDTLPSELLSSVEGLLIYFDADKVSLRSVAFDVHLLGIYQFVVPARLTGCDQSPSRVSGVEPNRSGLAAVRPAVRR